MRLSVSVNFFNGEELLFDAIRTIRPLVEHVSIVFQTVSNFGRPISSRGYSVLDRLQVSGLVDDFLLYRPDFSISPTQNEFRKRQIGLDLAKAAGATHFLLMDADEFYVAEEFIQARKIIEEEGIDYSSVPSFFYIQKPIYRSSTPDTTNVCFIARICDALVFSLEGEFPVGNVDPTRRLAVQGGRFKSFNSNEIAMHHMNFVRSSFDSKLENTSSAVNARFIREATNALESWQYPNSLAFPNKPCYQIIQVGDRFSLGESLKEREVVASVRADAPSVLIGTLWLNGFTGSEIVALETAEYFCQMGWNVWVYAADFSEPAVGAFYELGPGIKLIFDPYDEEFVSDIPNLQFCWIQHQMIPESLLDYIENGGEKPFFVFNHMSPFEKFERPVAIGGELALADRIVCNSVETRDALLPFFENRGVLSVFPNPAPSRYFRSKESHVFFENKPSTCLKTVVIVSNHPPVEVMETMELLRARGVAVNWIGMHGDLYVRTSPELLSNYDVVVTIGKTVQYCLALAIPVYVYDQHGGCGFLSSRNYQLCKKHNFSGRPFAKMSSLDLERDLIEGMVAGSAFVKNLPDSERNSFNSDVIYGDMINESLAVRLQPIRESTRPAINLLKAYGRNVRTALNHYKEKSRYQMKSLENRLEESVKAIDALRYVIRETDSVKEAAEHKVSVLEARVANVMCSASWRITAPLRWVASKIRYLVE